MKLKTLIRKLQKLEAEHGNPEVAVSMEGLPVVTGVEVCMQEDGTLGVILEFDT